MQMFGFLVHQRIRIFILFTTFSCAETGRSSESETSGRFEYEFEPIIVTAEKIPSSILTTPISVSAYSGEMLEGSSTETFQELALRTPGIAIGNTCYKPCQNQVGL